MYKSKHNAFMHYRLSITEAYILANCRRMCFPSGAKCDSPHQPAACVKQTMTNDKYCHLACIRQHQPHSVSSLPQAWAYFREVIMQNLKDVGFVKRRKHVVAACGNRPFTLCMVMDLVQESAWL
eukprot:jgi/Ulvmu1/7466/UM037_0009.1